MTSKFKYRIYCITNSRFEYIWDTVAPTTCPVNAGHTVNLSSVHQIRSIDVYKEVNATATADGNNFYQITASSNISFSLPPTAEAQDRVIIVQRLVTNANTVTIFVDNAGTEVINGGPATSYALTTNKQTVKLRATGTNWVILNISTDEGEDKVLLEGNLLRDTDNTDPNDGNFYLGWSQTEKKYVARQISYSEIGGALAGALALEELTNVTSAVDPGNDNRVLKWNDTTNKWVDAQLLVSYINGTVDHVPLGNGTAGMTEIKYNLTAVVTPTVNDDQTLGYRIGSRWINMSTSKEYVCLSAVLGAAVWKETTQIGTGIGAYTIGDILYANTTSSLTTLSDIVTGNALISGGVSTAPLWGKIGLTTHVTGTLPAFYGGTNQSSYTIGDMLYASSSSVLSKLAPDVTGNSLLSGTIPSWGKIGLTTHITGTLPATNGGSGQSTYTTGDILYASSSSALSKLAAVASGNVLRSGGVGVIPNWGKVDLTTHITGTLVETSGGTGKTFYDVGDILYANTTTSLAKLPDITIGNALITGGVGVAPSYGKIGLTTHISGTLPITNGGTNIVSYTIGDILFASGTTTLSKLPDIATGNVLITGGVGVAPSYGKVGLTTHVTGTLPVASGGTNLTSYTIGDLIFASGTTTLSKLADIATGNVLLTGGVSTAPSYGKVGLTTHISGTLAVANGGTGATTLSGYMIGNGTSAVTALKSEFAKTAEPTTGDDTGDGYVVGSRWIDTTADREYICLDATASTAVWKEVVTMPPIAGGGYNNINSIYSPIVRWIPTDLSGTAGALLWPSNVGSGTIDDQGTSANFVAASVGGKAAFYSNPSSETDATKFLRLNLGATYAGTGDFTFAFIVQDIGINGTANNHIIGLLDATPTVGADFSETTNMAALYVQNATLAFRSFYNSASINWSPGANYTIVDSTPTLIICRYTHSGTQWKVWINKATDSIVATNTINLGTLSIRNIQFGKINNANQRANTIRVAEVIFWDTPLSDGIIATLSADLLIEYGVRITGGSTTFDFTNRSILNNGTNWRAALKSEYTKTLAPTVNDDTGDGYEVGSRWFDITNDKEYVCLDATLSAAVWKETSGAGSSNGVFSSVFEFRTDTITPGTGQLVLLNAGNVNQTNITLATKIRINKKDAAKLDFLGLGNLTNETIIIRRQGTDINASDSVHQATLSNSNTDQTTYWELGAITATSFAGTVLVNKERVVFDFRPTTELNRLKDVTITTPQVNEVLTYDGSKWVNVGGADYVVWIFSDTKTLGTVGGTGTVATWTTRTINTTDVNAGAAATLVGNQLTLQAGNWVFEVYSLFNNTDETKIRLRNITDSTTVLASVNNTITTNNSVTLQAAAVLGGTKTFEIQYYITTSNANTDLGLPSGIESEIYTQLKLTRLSSNLGAWILTDTKIVGSVGGTATIGTWTTRTINTVTVNGGTNVSIALNQITLAAGNYLVDIISSFNNTDQTRLRLRNITSATTELTSISKTITTSDYLPLNAYLNLSAVTIFEVQYYATTTNANTDLGLPDGITGNEIYTTVRILKI